MKKNLISLAVITTAVFWGASAMATSGQVNFTGEIVDAGCNIVNTPSSPLNVVMGQVAKSEFTGTGSTAAPTKFTLVLTNCPATVSMAKIKFDGSSVNGDTSLLALTQESGVAQNVAIQLTDDNNTVVPLFTETKTYMLTDTQDNNLEFIARYIATSDTVNPGPANSVANFSVIYN
ncbi:fimbrial protein [Rahnella bonaserana]|jgi:major type 1 subunit fimbrin (pilin)|uniref:Fimbrial protein n=2 Tax=Rahnella bonaserana TaxID=2816248 RepID=A0ABS6LXU5_9GAMM|nr:fimbrial protein [Rahnella bonaserana]MBU9856919.1 fimbrial protein [Rahnella bonaserana]